MEADTIVCWRDVVPGPCPLVPFAFAVQVGPTAAYRQPTKTTPPNTARARSRSTTKRRTCYGRRSRWPDPAVSRKARSPFRRRSGPERDVIASRSKPRGRCARSAVAVVGSAVLGRASSPSRRPVADHPPSAPSSLRKGREREGLDRRPSDETDATGVLTGSLGTATAHQIFSSALRTSTHERRS